MFLRTAGGVILTFDLWMKKNLVNVFGLNAHFIFRDIDEHGGLMEWKKMVMCIGITEIDSQKAAGMKPKVIKALQVVDLLNKIFCSVSDGGLNLKKLSDALGEVTCCEAASIDQPFIGDCLCHALNDAERHATSLLVETPTAAQKMMYQELVPLTLVHPTKTKTKFMKVVKFTKKSDVGMWHAAMHSSI